MPSRATEPESRLYDDEVDFDELALEDGDFAAVYKAGGGRVDFQDPKTLQQLTNSLLKRDFGLTIRLPDDRLCPPVPVRYNYVAWLQYLLDTTPPSITDSYDVSRAITGLDIGTGASAIYPLIATTLRPSWTMHATDIDVHSLSYAKGNITSNDLISRIHIHHTEPSSPLIPLSTLGTPSLDFTMCNPPFYSSPEELTASHDAKSRPPSAICTGAPTEMIYPGGDAAFVLRLIDESLQLRSKVGWYTSMLGKLSSVHVIVTRLKAEGISNWAVTSLRAGKRTRRWAVGWSFGDRRPRNDVMRSGELVQAVLPHATAQTVDLGGLSRGEAAGFVNEIMGGLDLKWQWESESWSGVGLAKENVWSRAARRKHKRMKESSLDENEGEDKSDSGGREGRKEMERVALAFKIVVKRTGLEVCWLKGHDYLVFESFCGMLKRAVRERG